MGKSAFPPLPTRPQLVAVYPALFSFPFLSFRKASPPSARRVSRVSRLQNINAMTHRTALLRHSRSWCVMLQMRPQHVACRCIVFRACFYSWDNHVLRGPLSRSLRSFAWTAHSALSLHSVAPFTGSLFSLTPSWDDWNSWICVHAVIGLTLMGLNAIIVITRNTPLARLCYVTRGQNASRMAIMRCVLPSYNMWRGSTILWQTAGQGHTPPKPKLRVRFWSRELHF